MVACAIGPDIARITTVSVKMVIPADSVKMQIHQCSGEGDCSNNGNCEDDGYGNMFCNCNAEYTGFYCETQLSCMSEECRNGGYCMEDADGVYYCKCPEGYTGTKCEIAIPSCTSCLVNTTCYSDPCECQGRNCPDPEQIRYTTCIFCESFDYDECYYDPRNSRTLLCEQGCMSFSYRTGEGIWIERSCADDGCWNGCYGEAGMEQCKSCCYDDKCNTYDPLFTVTITAASGLLGISVVGTSMACALAIVVA
ncbi:uncharacterized protein LOC100370210 [Saccoglossus kowalevskii]|uniref:Neurogenic locus notch homolog protein 1-like n=1 Tax=Saccoglossus kowalevskii TaxID=10224 RepID=A0ABM0M998_SACKO|nr:PREDICTED: neurogenic locus notch homolog protein 1-like [Saccoglossus kowalevskii]